MFITCSVPSTLTNSEIEEASIQQGVGPLAAPIGVVTIIVVGEPNWVGTFVEKAGRDDDLPEEFVEP